MGPLKYGASPGVYTRAAGSIPGGSISILYRHLLYYTITDGQGEISPLAARFCNSLRAAVIRRSLAHDENDSPARRAAFSRSTLTSGGTRTCRVLRLAPFSFGLPVLTMRLIVLQNNCSVNKISLDCILKCSTINQDVVSEG